MGKVGQTFIRQFPADRPYGEIRAFCHKRTIEETDRVDVFRGDIKIQADVQAAIDGVTHVAHLATCKETPDDVTDVTVKGLFRVLEECRESASFQQFILIGGDASMGHLFIHIPFR